MKQALVSLFRSVVGTQDKTRTSSIALAQLSNVQLRLVSGGGNQVDSPRNVW